eukprot:5811206-Lingulodinium_polyedra.AAC.1
MCIRDSILEVNYAKERSGPAARNSQVLKITSRKLRALVRARSRVGVHILATQAVHTCAPRAAAARPVPRPARSAAGTSRRRRQEPIGPCGGSNRQSFEPG